MISDELVLKASHICNIVSTETIPSVRCLSEELKISFRKARSLQKKLLLKFSQNPLKSLFEDVVVLRQSTCSFFWFGKILVKSFNRVKPVFAT